MGKVFIFAENSNGDFKRGTYELLTAAQNSNNEVSVIAVGPGADALSAKLSGWGVQNYFVCTDANFKNYNPELFLNFIAETLQAEKPNWVFASSTMLARDLFPRVAARMDAGYVSDCTELSLNGDAATVRRPFFSGKCSAAVEFIADTMKIVLMRPNQLPVGTPAAGDAKLKSLSVSPLDMKTRIKEVIQGQSGKSDLTEANIVVSGGRGMQGAEHFKLLEDLATAVDATVGASRAVVDAGWVPHSMQVGQTGKTVAPTLYIACGISGAIQHLAGMSGSKVIVAINKDAEAPIFQKATYGVVGDVFEVLPLLTSELKALQS